MTCRPTYTAFLRMGEARRASVLVQPLISRDRFTGVLEAASFGGFTHAPGVARPVDRVPSASCLPNHRGKIGRRVCRAIAVPAQQLQTRQEQLQQKRTRALQEKARLLAGKNEEVERKKREVEQAPQERGEGQTARLTSSTSRSFGQHDTSCATRSTAASSSPTSCQAADGKLTPRAKTRIGFSITADHPSSGTTCSVLINDMPRLSKIESGTVMVGRQRSCALTT